MFRSYRFKLHPSPAQAETLERWAAVTRCVYNLAVEQRRDWHRHYKATTGRGFTFGSQCAELTDLRMAYAWLAEPPRTTQEEALKDVERAFSVFFRGGGFPRFRRKGDHETMRFRGRECRARKINGRWGAVMLPKLGEIRFRLTREIPPDLRSVTVAMSEGGWIVVLNLDLAAPESAPIASSVGLDRGVAHAITLSTGEHIDLPAQARMNRRVASAQRRLARRKRGSNRYKRQKARIAALRAKAARIRADALHKASTAIVRRYGVVAMEALKISNMTAAGRGKRGLNRSILEQGWAMFGRMLAYKLEATGGKLLTCDPAYTSQTCSACGVIDKASRKSQAVFTCVACGHHDNADVNAAKNILRRSTAWLHGEGQTIAPASREPAMAA